MENNKKPAPKKAAVSKKAAAKKTKTLTILAAVSIVLAVILLLGSLPGLIPLLRGQAAVSDASDLGEGRYVRLDMDNILGIYADNYDPGRPDTVTSTVAVMKLGSQLVSVRLPMRLADGANSLMQQTQAQYQSGAAAPATDILIYGTVAKVDDNTKGLLYTWYGNNSSWLSAAGLTSGSADASTVLSDYIIKADALGSYPSLWLFWLVFSATLFFIIAAFVLSLVAMSRKPASGKASPTPAAKKKDVIKPVKKDEKNDSKDENDNG